MPTILSASPPDPSRIDHGDAFGALHALPLSGGRIGPSIPAEWMFFNALGSDGEPLIDNQVRVGLIGHDEPVESRPLDRETVERMFGVEVPAP